MLLRYKVIHHVAPLAATWSSTSPIEVAHMSTSPVGVEWSSTSPIEAVQMSTSHVGVAQLSGRALPPTVAAR